MNTDRFREKFLEEINKSCFPINSGGNKKIREQAFLKRRFHPDNYQPELKQHKEIARQIQKELNIDCQNAIGTTCQNVIRVLVEQYGSEMETDGVDVSCLVNGKKGKKGHWAVVYDWLYEHKFPRWLVQKNRVWQAWKAEAKSNVGKISFEEVDYRRKPKGSQPRKKEQLPMNQDLSMKIELKVSGYYLLLFSLSKSLQGEETRYLFCPSKAFSPNLQPINDEFFLPQSNAEFGAIEFDEIGIEEYLGILLKEKPTDLDWITSVNQESFPIWNELQMYQLWQGIQKQKDYRVFYQCFEVIVN